MELWSVDFEHKGRIPTNCTSDGDNRPPELHWRGVPPNASELAVTCEDVDAPGGTLVHWVLWGLHPSMSMLGADVPRHARSGRNDFDGTGYRGPSPPPGHGYHHYHFRLYAVSERLDVPTGSSINELRRAMDGKILDIAELVGIYAR